ncbi:XrtA/PEP-CTERM system exopolysaccharide export protein [Thioalkalivibrio sp.]|uniref:XrtA/PEP-CTERM system exopolysaccharide export protein n=1 Tax=Chromatiales TaxID=135613 RepID=UPI003563F8A9
MSEFRRRVAGWGLALIAALLLGGCAGGPTQPPPPEVAADADIDYRIAPGDNVNIFVWRQPELSTNVPVRPDGRISTPLVKDVVASGKTTTELARDMEEVLAEYIRDPVVTVTVTQFAGAFSQQVRVVGQAVNPEAVPYREGMTALDVLIAVGGLTDFAAGNRSTIVREVDGERQSFGVRLNDLVRRGDIEANVRMLPGDILIIPETRF